MNSNRKKIRLITQTALIVAMLIGLQAATAPLAMPIITGSLVNMMLVVSVMTSGVPSAVAVALISPVFAKLFGIGPLWSLIPCIMAGNLVLVLLWHFIVKLLPGGKYAGYFIALASGAVAKFLVLYLSIVKLVIPVFLDLPEKQAATISAMFSVQQLFTALVGGALALAIFPVVRKALPGIILTQKD